MSGVKSANVILVRHAHAEWPGYTGRDFDRPLTPRGMDEALITARAIAAITESPALLLASPARRTQQTAEIIAHELGLNDAQVRFVDKLYNASSGTLEAELRGALPDTGKAPGALILISHNPGVSELARRLSGDVTSSALPTGGWRMVRLQPRIAHQG
jgi:phosphohistidine phosphatase